MYDWLIVGSGLYGAVFAHQMHTHGKSCLVIDRRSHIGGNVYTEEHDGINLHIYGAHIFHTNDRRVWDFVNRSADFNQYINSPIANYHGELYPLPFNMHTFHALWGVNTPAEAQAKIEETREDFHPPKNLEEQAVSLVGRDIYEKLIKGYTEKQWGRLGSELPPFIIKRLPVRFTFDNNYFNARYQGIPIGGYTSIIKRLLSGSDVELGINFNDPNIRKKYAPLAANILYTGSLDEYFNYSLGVLGYRGLRFETERLAIPNYQGVAVMNFTAADVPYTRIIEHKHFEYGNQPVTHITREYPATWKIGDEAFYPINDEANQALYERYASLAAKEKNLHLGGRLALYKYYDMDKIIALALEHSQTCL